MSYLTKEGFEPNHREFGMHVRSEVARAPALQVATKIAQRANAIAPFDPDKAAKSKRRRRLRYSYTAGPTRTIRVGRYGRAAAQVYSDVIEASTQEFGTSTQPANRPLLRAAFLVIIGEGLGTASDFRVGDTTGQGGA